MKGGYELIMYNVKTFNRQDFYLPLFADDSRLINNEDCLSEDDFYPMSDNRIWTSNIKDINGGDNFADYCEYFFKMLEEEGYYDD